MGGVILGANVGCSIVTNGDFCGVVISCYLARNFGLLQRGSMSDGVTRDQYMAVVNQLEVCFI